MLRLLLLGAAAGAAGWSTGARQGTAEASSEPLLTSAAKPAATARARANLQLFVKEPPAEIVTAGPEKATISIDRLPVMRMSEGIRDGAEEGRISQLVSLIASTSANVRILLPIPEVTL